MSGSILLPSFTTALFIATVELEQFFVCFCNVSSYHNSVTPVLRFPYLADGLRLEVFLSLLWQYNSLEGFLLLSPSPTLRLVLTFCKSTLILWTLTSNMAFLLWLWVFTMFGKVVFFLFKAFISFPWNNLLGLVFSHWYVLGFISTGIPLPPAEKQRLLWRVSLTITEFMIALCSTPWMSKIKQEIMVHRRTLSTPHISASKLPYALGPLLLLFNRDTEILGI